MEFPQQSEVLSLHRIDRLASVRKKARVHCAVRTEFLNIIQVKFSPIGYAMVQEVCRRSLNSEAVFVTISDYTRLVVAKVALGQIFLRIILYFLSISFRICSILVIIYMFLLPERQTDKPWETSEKQRSFGNRGKLDRKVLHFFQSYHCLFYLTDGQSHANRWSRKFPLHCSFYWDRTISTNLEVLQYVWVCWHISNMEFGKQMGVAAAH